MEDSYSSDPFTGLKMGWDKVISGSDPDSHELVV